MRLDRNAVGRAERVKVERGHDGGERGGGCLMAADFHTVAILAHMIGVMNHPGREPQRLALERGEDGEIVGMSDRGWH